MDNYSLASWHTQVIRAAAGEKKQEREKAKMYLGPHSAGPGHRDPGRGWGQTKSSFHQHQGKSQDRRMPGMQGRLDCEQQTLFLPSLNHHLFNYTLKAQGHSLSRLAAVLVAPRPQLQRGAGRHMRDLIHNIIICPWLIEGSIMNYNYLHQAVVDLGNSIWNEWMQSHCWEEEPFIRNYFIIENLFLLWHQLLMEIDKD